MRKRSHTWLIIVLALVMSNTNALGQPKWTYYSQVNFGANLLLVHGPSQHFPGVKFFAGFSATATRGDLLLSYGPTISVYTKTIGANLNPLVGDWQIDLNNAITVGGAWGNNLAFWKFMRTIHNGESYNIMHRRDAAVLLSTNFILNNHRRHQVIGSINVTGGPVSINYYNDGSPFHLLGLGDSFDRYWTGGGTLIVHSKQGYNLVEFSYDQFTGYVPLLYELSGQLGINIPLYDTPGKRKVYNFNTSAYNLRVNLGERFSAHAGVMGSLKSKGNRYWGIQDIIHLKGHYPFHPNNDGNRFFFGGTYQQYESISL